MKSGVIGQDEREWRSASAIAFPRIAGGKPFDITQPWFTDLLADRPPARVCSADGGFSGAWRFFAAPRVHLNFAPSAGSEELSSWEAYVPSVRSNSRATRSRGPRIPYWLSCVVSPLGFCEVDVIRERTSLPPRAVKPSFSRVAIAPDFCRGTADHLRPKIQTFSRWPSFDLWRVFACDQDWAHCGPVCEAALFQIWRPRRRHASLVPW